VFSNTAWTDNMLIGRMGITKQPLRAGEPGGILLAYWGGMRDYGAISEHDLPADTPVRVLSVGPNSLLSVEAVEPAEPADEPDDIPHQQGGITDLGAHQHQGSWHQHGWGHMKHEHDPDVVCDRLECLGSPPHNAHAEQLDD